MFYYADYRQAFPANPLYSGFLTQCWSLAVEEQFYLIWAPLLLVALRVGYRKLAYVVICTGIVVCTVNRMHIVLSAHPWNLYAAQRTYNAFDTRADALFVGCLLGMIATGGYLEGWQLRARRALIVATLAATAVMIWIVVNVHLAYRSLPLVWIPVSEIASAVVIAYFIVQPKGLGTRVVGLSGLVLVGDMSYTIYLIHWPVYTAVSPSTVGWSYWVLDVVRLAIIIPLAVASWYLMERPLMRWRKRKFGTARTVEPLDSG